VTVFISYASSRERRKLLSSALRDHGLRPWRDVETLNLSDPTTDTITSELATSAAAILWIDRAFLASVYVQRVELPAVARAFRRGLRVLPVFDGLTPTEASDALSAFGIEIGENNGHVVDDSVSDADTAAAIARGYLLRHLIDARATGTGDPALRVVTYDDTAALRDDAVLNFDWRHRVTEGTLAHDDEKALRDALHATAGVVKQVYGPLPLALAIKAHLPIAVAVGHAFAETSGSQLRMARDAEVFVTGRPTAAAPLLQLGDGMKGPATLSTASVEVSVARDVEAGVTRSLSESHRYRHRIMLRPVDGPSRDALADAATAAVWAKQVAETVLAAVDAGDVHQIDLYLATPVELAVMIGWWLNAAGRIDLMNWRGKTGPYERMWSLP
jgi:hypothetical protein